MEKNKKKMRNIKKKRTKKEYGRNRYINLSEEEKEKKKSVRRKPLQESN